MAAAVRKKDEGLADDKPWMYIQRSIDRLRFKDKTRMSVTGT